MKINIIQFLVTISHNIKFGTAETLPNGTFNKIAKAIRKVIILYNGWFFGADGQVEGI